MSLRWQCDKNIHNIQHDLNLFYYTSILRYIFSSIYHLHLDDKKQFVSMMQFYMPIMRIYFENVTICDRFTINLWEIQIWWTFIHDLISLLRNCSNFNLFHMMTLQLIVTLKFSNWKFTFLGSFIFELTLNLYEEINPKMAKFFGIS